MLSRVILSPAKRLCLVSHAVRRVHATPLLSASAHDHGHGHDSHGHHDHHGPELPVPVYIPRPSGAERNIFGSVKVPTIGGVTPYVPTASCIASYVGAGVGILLTFLAIVTYTDAFKAEKAHKHASHEHSKQEDKHKEEHREAPKPSPPAEPVNKEEPKTTETAIGESKPAAPEESASTSQDSNPTPAELAKEPESPTPEAKSEVVEEEKQAEILPSSSSEPTESSSTQSESKVPAEVEYLLVGGGTAAYYAALAIRARQAEAKVLMIGDERHLPYNRPPLSKELWWYGDEKTRKSLEYKALSGKTRDVFFETEGFFIKPDQLHKAVHGGVSLLRGHRVVKLCPDDKQAILDDGTMIKYNKCLIATGGQPRRVPELETHDPRIQDKIIYLRGVDDYRKLDELCAKAGTITIVGGGFIGSELAYSIKRRYDNVKINQVISEKSNLANVLPEFLSQKATDSLRSIGINVVSNAKITGSKASGDAIEIQMSNNAPLKSDYVVIAVGIEPDVEIAEASGLEIDPVHGGVIADAELRVRSDIYAAGDVCSFYDKSLGRRRVEHWENAQISGRLAGENMTGGQKSFTYQPSFFTKISPDMHINAVGNTDSSLSTVSVFAKDDEGANEHYDRGVVFYKGADDRVVGVLLLNVFGSSIDVARRLIEDARPVTDFRQLSKLFPLYTPEKAEEEQEKKSEK